MLALLGDLALRAPRRGSGRPGFANAMCMATMRASSGVACARTSTPIFCAGGWTYAATTSPSPASKRSAPRRRCSRRSSRRARPAPPRGTRAASGALARGRRRGRAGRTPRNSSFSETGSVSQPTATIAPVRPSTCAHDLALGRLAAGALAGLRPCPSRAGAAAPPRGRRPSRRARACSPSSPRR